MKRAVLYARVSTDESAEHGYSLPSQLEACRQYAESNGFEVVAEFKDDYTGMKLDRPGLEQVRTMITRKELDAIIVYASDRLTRNLAHSLILREEFQSAGIELHYHNRGKSEDTPESRFTENMEGVFNEYWREKIIEANRRGKIGKAKSGKWMGTRAPYGYRKIGKGREAYLEIDETQAAVVRRIFEMYVGHNGQKPQTFLNIAVILTAEQVPISGNSGNRHPTTTGWTDGTVNYLLQNTAYIGEFRYAGIVMPFPELAIIDRAMFEAAMERRKENARKASRSRKYDYLLAGGYIRCTCGCVLVSRCVYSNSRGKGKRYFYYACSNHQRRFLYHCEERHVRAEVLEAIVWDWIYNLLSDEARLEEGINQMLAENELELSPKRDRLETIRRLISQYEQKIARLAKAYGDAPSDTVADALQTELNEVGKLHAALRDEGALLEAEINQNVLLPEEMAALKRTAAELREELTEPDFETKRYLIDRLRLKGQLINEDGKRFVRLSCALQPAAEVLPVENSCSNPDRTYVPSRNSSATPTSKPP